MNDYAIRCIAIDDEPLALDLLAAYLKKFPRFTLIETFEDAIGGAEFVNNHPIDLLFVDIQMPDISGLDLVGSLKDKPMVIFTTAYRNFAHEGFELEALDYLVKPISMDRFTRAIQKAQDYYQYKHQIQPNAGDAFYVYSKYQKIKIHSDEVIYIESLKDYCKIHLDKGDPVLTLAPLKKLQQEISSDRFIRIHRSFIIPLQKIRSYSKQKVLLTTGVELPVSSKFADDLIRAISGL